MDGMSILNEEQAIKRQRLMAEMLRAQQQQQQAPQGQMVGGRYVAPSVLQQILPLINAAKARGAEQELAVSEQAYAGRLSKARESWAAAQPQATPAQEGAPMDGSGPLLENQDTPAVPVQTGQILKHAMAGLAIPGNEKSAQLYQTGALAEQAREDNQAERRSSLAQTMQLQREKQAQELEFKRAKLEQEAQALQEKLEQKGLDRQSAAQMHAALMQAKAAHDATLLQIAKLNQDRKADKQSHTVELGVEKLSRRADPVINILTPATKLQGLIDKYTNKDGTVRDIPGIGLATRMKDATGAQIFMGAEETANFTLLQGLTNALVREQAGLSQTLSEAAKALAEQARKGTAGQPQFIAAWKNLRDKLNDEVANLRTYSPEVLEVYDARKANTPLQAVKSSFGAEPEAAPAGAWTVKVKK